MNLESNNDKILRKLDALAETEEDLIIPKPELKQTEILAKFNEFVSTIKKLDADDDHVKASLLYDTYDQIFGEAGAGKTTLGYRIRTLAPEYPDDILLDPEAKNRVGDSAYYINRANEDLIKKIYFPAYKRPGIVSPQEKTHRKDIEAMQDLGIINHSDEEGVY
jgi:hypothetical protein